jgi:hypothetical protein
MRQESRRVPLLLELLASLWIVAAQVYYYSQFKEQFRSIFVQTFAKLWP